MTGPGARAEGPVLSTAERDRRWRLAQELMESRDLTALLAYGERDTVGQPLYAPDAWLTNDRPGNAVVVPRGEDPYVMVSSHIAVGQHIEAGRRGDELWIEPGHMIAGDRHSRPGTGRGAAAIAEFLHWRGLDGGRVGVVGLEPFPLSFPNGIIPYGTYKGLADACPETTFVPVGADWHMMVITRSDEEIALIEYSARGGEAMCEAMIAAARPGVAEHELYAAAMEACFRAGSTQHWMVLITARDGENVGWGPPAWTYRAQPPGRLRDGDLVLAELFPVYGMLESQQQLTIAIGEVHPDIERAGAIARQSYDAGLAALQPGSTFGQVVDAISQPVREAGGWSLTPPIHSLNPNLAVGACGLPPDLPEAGDYGGLGGVGTSRPDLELKPGMSFAFQPNCSFGRRRVNIGGTVVLTPSGPRELNDLSNRLQRA